MVIIFNWEGEEEEEEEEEEERAQQSKFRIGKEEEDEGTRYSRGYKGMMKLKDKTEGDVSLT